MYLNVLRRAGPAAGLLLLVTLGLPNSAFGLDPSRQLTQYVHRIWQTQQGLPQGSILQITQTREGYLWLATQTGLVRFDGVRFQDAEDIIPGAPANLWARVAWKISREGYGWAPTNRGSTGWDPTASISSPRPKDFHPTLYSAWSPDPRV